MPKRCYRTAPCKELSIHRGSTFGFGSHFLARQSARPIDVGDEYPSAVRALRMGAKSPRLTASPMSPSTRSATLPTPTWPRALGSIAGCATSAPASRPASPASGGGAAGGAGSDHFKAYLVGGGGPQPRAGGPPQTGIEPHPLRSLATAIISTRLAYPCTLTESSPGSCYVSAKCHLATSRQTRLQPSIVLKTGVYRRALD